MGRSPPGAATTVHRRRTATSSSITSFSSDVNALDRLLVFPRPGRTGGLGGQRGPSAAGDPVYLISSVQPAAPGVQYRSAAVRRSFDPLPSARGDTLTLVAARFSKTWLKSRGTDRYPPGVLRPMYCSQSREPPGRRPIPKGWSFTHKGNTRKGIDGDGTRGASGAERD